MLQLPSRIFFFLLTIFIGTIPVHASTFSDSFDTTNFVQTSSGLYYLSGGTYALDFQGANPHTYPARVSSVFSQDVLIKGTTYSGFTFPETKGTMEFWINGTFTQSGIRDVMDGYDSTREHIFLRTYDLEAGKNAQIAAQTIGRVSYPFVVNFFIPDNVWNFLVITWDTTDSSMDVYLNGALVKHGTITSPTWKPSAELFRWNNAFSGQMSYARVLSEKLSLDDGRSDYSNTYLSSGALVSQVINPVSLSSWQDVIFNANTPVNTGLKVSLEYDHNGTWESIPEGSLSGNTQGFSASPIDLSNLSPVTYKKIRLKGIFSSNGISTPELLDWDVHWTGGLTTHPRLYLNAPKIALIKSRIATNTEPYKSRWAAIQTLANAYTIETPPVYGVGNAGGANVDNTIRALGNKLPFMALAYLLTDDPKYLSGAKVWINTLASYPHWGSNDLAPDLGNAHLLYNMAIAYDWLYNSLTPTERTLYENTMEKQAKVMTDAMEAKSPIWWTTSYGQNHNYVNIGSVMTAAIATYDTMTNADHAVHLAYDNFTKVLASLSTDGASHEGLSYWEYGIESLIRYFDIEKSVFGIDRMATSPWFQKAYLFRLYGSLPDYWHHILYGDAVEHPWYGPTFFLHYLASEFHNTLAQWLANTIDTKRKSAGGGTDTDWRTLLWYDETITETSPSALPTYKLFDDLGVFTSRSRWSDDNAIEFALKAAPPSGHSLTSSDSSLGHVHPDEGAFTLNGFGKNLIIDDGYSYLKMTSNHNVATFDGSGQIGEGNVWFGSAGSGSANIIYTDLENTQGYEYLIADLTQIYKPTLGITKYLRHYIFLKKKTLVLIDEIESSQDHSIEWRLHMNNDAIFSLSGKTLSGTLNTTNIGLVVDDVSEEAHTYSLDKEAIASANLVMSATFHTNTFQIKKTGRQARIESVIRPFQGISPAALQVSRKNGYLIISLDDSSFAGISTTARKVYIGTDSNNIPPVVIPVTTPVIGGNTTEGATSSSQIDVCVSPDTSGSLYDGKCSISSVMTGSLNESTGSISSTGISDISPTRNMAHRKNIPTKKIIVAGGTISHPFSDLFTDIHKHWSESYVEQLFQKGVIQEANQYYPNNRATRAEFLKISLKGLGIVANDSGKKTDFSDVTESWQIPLVAKAKEMGIISGQKTNKGLIFRPNDTITRAEAMKILLMTAGYVSNVTHTDFFDVTESWQIPLVAKAKELGIISGQKTNKGLIFRPNDTITRAEVAKIVVKLIELKK